LSVFNRTTNAWVVLSNPTSNVPVGSILTHAGATPPTSFLFAEGTSLLKATYPALFSVIGTQYGSASSTHFSLPNLKGRVVVGVDTGQAEFSTLGEVGGRKTTSHASYDAPVNSNSFQAGGQNYANAVVAQMNTYLTANGSSTVSRNISIQSVGGQILAQSTGATEVRNLQYTATNLQPYAAMRYIIKF
jgi:microcystin-dependent protein